jgi:[ribosomal protein S5]-alanine N-acetyltransferase
VKSTLISSPADKLTIRPFSEADAVEFFELTCDDGFNAFPINVYRQKNIETAREWIKNARGKYGVWENGKLIGMGGLTFWNWEGEELVDITYRLRESAWGRGLGWELARSLRDYGFETLKLPQITATITPDNIPSKKIAERLGLKFDKKIILNNVDTELWRLKRA